MGGRGGGNLKEHSESVKMLVFFYIGECDTQKGA